MSTATKKFTGKQITDAIYAAAKRNHDGGPDYVEGAEIAEALATSPEGIKFLISSGMIHDLDGLTKLVQGIVVGLGLAAQQQKEVTV